MQLRAAAPRLAMFAQLILCAIALASAVWLIKSFRYQRSTLPGVSTSSGQTTGVTWECEAWSGISPAEGHGLQPSSNPPLIFVPKYSASAVTRTILLAPCATASTYHEI